MAITMSRIHAAANTAMAMFRFRLWPEARPGGKEKPLPPGTLVVLSLPGGAVTPAGWTGVTGGAWRVIQGGDTGEVAITAPNAREWDVEGWAVPPGGYTLNPPVNPPGSYAPLEMRS